VGVLSKLRIKCALKAIKPIRFFHNYKFGRLRYLIYGIHECNKFIPLHLNRCFSMY
jgi:hypothetical protein